MEDIYQLGFVIIQWLQTWSPGLDGFMKAITFLGTIEFYIIFIPALYWCVDQRLGMRTLFILLLTDIPASAFKQLLHQPRPYWFETVNGLAAEPSYGIPSTHASNTLAVWGLIAITVKKAWMWIFVFILLLLIGITRLYLGVHFPQDVLGGWLIGLALLLLFLRFEPPFLAWWRQKTINLQILLGFLASLGVIAVGLLTLAVTAPFPDPPEWASYATEARKLSHFITLAGFLFGTVAGMVLMQKHACFQVNGSAFQVVARYFLGMIGLFTLYLGLDVLFALLAPDASVLGYILRYVRYASVGLWAVFGAPWMFLKLGLATKQ